MVDPLELERPRILIVDDRPENLLTFEETLRDLDADLVSVRSGNEALSMLLEGSFALVLLDAHLPDLSGFEVLNLMSKVQRTKSIPIIFVSAVHKDESHIFKGYYLGAVDYLLKPFEPAILRSKVSVFLDLDRQEKQIERQNQILQAHQDTLEQRVTERTGELTEMNKNLQAAIAARKEVENALDSSERTLRSLLVHSPDVIIVLDGQDRIKFINHADSLPLANTLSTGDRLEDLPVHLAQRLSKELERERSGQKREVPVTLAIGDASWWECHTILSDYSSQEEGPGEVLLILRDVTEKREMLTQKLRHAHLVTVGTLAASVAHEVNNPANAILFNAGYLEKAWGDLQGILAAYHAQQGDFMLGGIPYQEVAESLPALLSGITKNAGRIQQIVASLKQAPHDPGTPPKQLALAAVVEESLAIHEHTLLHKSVTLTTHYLDELPRITGVQLQLEQVISNVIGNALEAMQQGEAMLIIRGAISTQNQRVELSITDNGAGMNEEQMQRACEPFYTTRRQRGGTGLGLAIAYRIVRAHGGELMFESPPEGQESGTRVILSLPTAEQSPEGAR
uniref:histidine kinase n=1 Tax=Magnetococcus massalia (strain MO-1) TaxID=451514 RepID=A0A1S7LHH2_MAGMO|nr:putative response regulator receiver domain modulated histidine kinase [Candidatus Magnetococcus massalia]